MSQHRCRQQWRTEGTPEGDREPNRFHEKRRTQHTDTEDSPPSRSTTGKQSDNGTVHLRSREEYRERNCGTVRPWRTQQGTTNYEQGTVHECNQRARNEERTSNRDEQHWRQAAMNSTEQWDRTAAKLHQHSTGQRQQPHPQQHREMSDGQHRREWPGFPRKTGNEDTGQSGLPSHSENVAKRRCGVPAGSSGKWGATVRDTP